MGFRSSIFDFRFNRLRVDCGIPHQSQITNRKSQISSRGFSFTELLFAVMILGVGFIMLAAIFPVGLSQTKSNFDENVGASIGKLSVGNIKGIATDTNLLPTPPITAPVDALNPGESISLGTVMSFRDYRWPSMDSWKWNDISPTMVLPTDNRFAWTALYMRKVKYTNNTAGAVSISTGTTPTGAANINIAQLTVEPEPIAQLIVFGMRINNRSEYTAPNYLTALAPVYYQIEPKPIYLTMDFDPESGSYIAHFKTITDIAPSPPYHGFVGAPYMPQSVCNQTINAVATGAVVVISDDRIIAPKNACGHMNGRIFRVGEKLDENSYGPNAWQLIPGNDSVLDVGPNGKLDDPAGTTGDDITQIGASDNIVDPTNPGGPKLNTTKNAGTKGIYDTLNSANSSDIAINSTSAPISGYATAFIIGRGYTISDQYPVTDPVITPGSPAAPSGFTSQYEGDVQDVSVYTTFVRVKQ